MFMMRADPLRRQGGGGWTLEIETFLGPVKWHRTVRRVPFEVQKMLFLKRNDKTLVLFTVCWYSFLYILDRYLRSLACANIRLPIGSLALTSRSEGGE
jgi:hypothetical protein